MDIIGGKTSIIESKAGDPPHNLRSDHFNKRSYVYLKWLW